MKKNNIRYTEESLEELSIHALRDISSSLRLNYTALLDRKKLIKGILEKTKNPKTSDSFNNVDIEIGGCALAEMTWSDYELAEEKIAEKNLLMTPYMPSLIATISVVDGFVFSLKDGSFLVVTEKGVIYKALMVQAQAFQAAHNIEIRIGDRVKAEVAEGSFQENYVVREILEIKQTKFRDEFRVRPTRRLSIEGGDSTFLVGGRAVVPTEITYDRVGLISDCACELKSKDKNFIMTTMLIEETADCKHFLLDNGVDSVSLIDVLIPSKEQVALANYMILKSKWEASEGKDIVLFIDNLSKLLSVLSRVSSTTDLINHALLRDLKNIFMSGGVLKTGGSLSIIALINKPPKDTHDYSYEEILSVAQGIYIQ